MGTSSWTKQKDRSRTCLAGLSSGLGKDAFHFVMSVAVKKTLLKRWRRDDCIHDFETREHDRRVVMSPAR